MAEEIWKEYKTYKTQKGCKTLCSFIKISDKGNVEIIQWNYKKKSVEIKNGRRYVGSTPIFRLVDRIFRGTLPEGYDVHHKDFNKLNDSLDNLERLTNAKHAEIHSTGRKRSKEAIEKTRLKNIGKRRTEEFKQKMREASTGKKQSEEAKEKNRLAHLGQKAWNKGLKMKPTSDETKQKISLANKGKKRTPEQRERMRIAALNRKIKKVQ